MIDIHSHILPFVDDGCVSLEHSIQMLEKAIDQGVTDLILTPHYKRVFPTTPEQIKKEFDVLNAEKNARNLPINLYLGHEIFMHKESTGLLLEDRLLTLNGTKYVLVEFKVREFSDIVERIYELVKAGYKPIVAHAERYNYFTIQDAQEVKELGGYIQVNAGSIKGKQRKSWKKRVRKLFKYSLVDFVASDAHEHRDNVMKKAKRWVRLRYGKNVAEKVFIENAKEIIKG